MTEAEKRIIQKKMKIEDLRIKVYDDLIDRFFDWNSDKLLDEKIAVLSDLAAGKAAGEVAGYYDILELLPNDGTHWD